MNRLNQLLVWLWRIRHSRGFGIQSPTDYRFVRYVVNERWPYYSYEDLGLDDDWLTRKLGRLYTRLANWMQPETTVDWVGVGKYISAGCKTSKIVDVAENVQLAIVPIKTDYSRLFAECGPESVVVFQDIWRCPALWRCIEHDDRAVLTFDLYYCGIVMFDKRREKKNYIVNF